MKKALVFTVYDRVNYFQQTLYTWRDVRGLKDWDVIFSIEPSDVQHQMIDEILCFMEDTGIKSKIIVNPERYGVLHHPWVVLENMFINDNYDFVVRAEDDLIVSDDILEYFSWAAEQYKDDEDVATVHGMSFDQSGENTSRVARVAGFNPWIWGTWRYHWSEYISPSWDHDYSTFNVYPGNQSGWDWNLNTRVFPALKFVGIYPEVSRVDNIGVYGTHGTAENFSPSPTFRKNISHTEYSE